MKIFMCLLFWLQGVLGCKCVDYISVRVQWLDMVWDCNGYWGHEAR
jgi:hypothetical protein